MLLFIRDIEQFKEGEQKNISECQYIKFKSDLFDISSFVNLRLGKLKNREPRKCERRDLNPWIPSKPDLKSGPFGQALVPSRLNTLVYLLLESFPATGSKCHTKVTQNYGKPYRGWKQCYPYSRRIKQVSNSCQKNLDDLKNSNVDSNKENRDSEPVRKSLLSK